MKFVLVAHSLRKGGGKTVGLNWIDGLARQRPADEGTIVVPDLPEYLQIALPSQYSVQVFKRRFGIISQFWFEKITIRKIIKSTQPDTVISLVNFAMPFKSKQAVLLHKAQYVTERFEYKVSPINAFKDWLGKRRLKKSLNENVLLLVQSPHIAELAKTTLGWAGTTLVTPPKVSTELFATEQAIPRFYVGKNHGFKLGMISAYYPQKNFEQLVEVFTRFRHELADVSLYITLSPNSDTGSKRLLQSIESRGIADHIINLGPLNLKELSWLYQQIDAIILPSLLESFSNNYIEAGFFSLPILTSDRPFARSNCGEAALYFEPTSQRSIADAILRVANDRELRLDYGQRSRALAEHNNEWDQQIDQILKALIDD